MSEIIQFKSPSQKKIKKLSSRYGVSEVVMTTAFGRALAVWRKEMSDMNSASWRACVASGSWRTPENNWCEKDYWPGCGVDSGASRCWVK